MKSFPKRYKQSAFLIGGGIAALAGIAFTPWSIEREVHEADIPEQEGVEAENTNSQFEEAFAAARNELGGGKIFEFNNCLYSTFYKDEWENLSVTEKEKFLNQFQEMDQDQIPVATMISDDMTPEDAFFMAREEIGPGGIFILNNQIYSTCTQEEIDNMDLTEKQNFIDRFESFEFRIAAENLHEINVVDLSLTEEYNSENTQWAIDDAYVYNDPTGINMEFEHPDEFISTPDEHETGSGIIFAHEENYPDFYPDNTGHTSYDHHGLTDDFNPHEDMNDWA